MRDLNLEHFGAKVAAWQLLELLDHSITRSVDAVLSVRQQGSFKCRHGAFKWVVLGD